MKTLLATILALAAGHWSTAGATTTLTSAWQEYLCMMSMSGPPARDIYSQGEAAVPGGRGFEFELLGDPVDPQEKVHSTLRQDTRILPDGIRCTGSARVERIRVLGGRHSMVSVLPSLDLTFEVTGQNETAKLILHRDDLNYPPGPIGIGAMITGGPSIYALSQNSPEVVLPPGVYRLNFQLNGYVINHAAFESEHIFGTADYDFEIVFTNYEIAPGALQSHPILPDTQSGLQFNFTGTGRRWYDPPVAQGFTFEGTGGTTFEKIIAPAGFEKPFFVIADGVKVGEVVGGESFNFIQAMGQPVPSFQIRNIFPYVPSDSVTAFPIMLMFAQPTGSFAMSPIDGPWLDFTQLENGQFQIEWGGSLQTSPDLKNWTAMTPATNPFVWTPEAGQGPRFFRSEMED